MHSPSRTLAALLACATLSALVSAAPEDREGAQDPTTATQVVLPHVYERQAEPREQAFTLMVPEGWSLSGGIQRIDPSVAGGPAQSIEAKLDLTLQDERGRVRLRRVADWYYCDVGDMPAAQLGLFPPGSNYQGMTVWPVQPATAFLCDVLFPREHPRASAVALKARKRLPKLARACEARLRKLALPLPFEFDAGWVRMQYVEGGVEYEELAFTLVEDRGPLAGGQWANRETYVVRAPAGELAAWEPVFAAILRSVRLRPQWFREELRNQLVRAGIWERVRGEVAKIEADLNAHRQNTRAEIMNDMFLTLTEQEEYLDPFTGETVLGSDQLGSLRWQTPGGDVVYTDAADFDPNASQALERNDWKRSRVRPR